MDDDRPTLRVISGDATPEEIAAILALVSARGSTATRRRAAGEERSGWSAPSVAHRQTSARPRARLGGWRTSSWPR
jgi:hypothetical protein